MTRPIHLSDDQMSAVWAASHPLAPSVRSAFLADVARELAALPAIGDGAVHRIVTLVQRKYFDPPSDSVASWDITQRDHVTKLTQAAPIEGEPARRSRSQRPTV